MADDLNVTGATIPGMPLVLIGHNERVAWGITLAFTDCQDLFIEQVDPEQPHRYRFRDEWREARVIKEAIQVRGRPQPHVERVMLTHHGPIVSDVVGVREQRVALNSMPLRSGPNNLKGWLLLNQAAGWDDFVGAMRYIDGPELSIAYADVDGNIGYWMTGAVPVRAGGDGRVPVPGWTGEYEWVGRIPFEEMPHALNPEQGYIATCNHRIVPDDYPHFLGNIWNNGYRARRLIEVLESRERFTLADCRHLQADFGSVPGRELLKHLEGLAPGEPALQQALHCLRTWDGKLTAGTVGGTLYKVMQHFTFRNLLEPRLGETWTQRLLGKGFHPLLYPVSEWWSQDTATLLRLLAEPNSRWVAQAGGREALLLRSLQQAVRFLEQRLGPDMTRWEWGRLHRCHFPHAMGAQKPLDRVFDRGGLPIGGDADTLFLTAAVPGDPAEHPRLFAPSYRQIADMEDLARSVAILPPGQSGHLASPHYDDLIQPWLTGEYHPMLWTRVQIEAHLEARLLLQP